MKSKNKMEENPYKPEYFKIVKITKETADTSTFKIKLPSNHDPGMFLEVSLTGYGEAPISICSYDDNYSDLCIRKVGRLTNKILDLKEGQNIGIRGPYGKGYPMKQFMYKNLVVVGGGTGVAPLKGVFEYLISHRKEFKDVDVFLGFRSPSDILFKKDIKKWNDKFNLEMTVDKPDEKWKGNVGVITQILENSDINKDNTIIITCGPPIMIKFVIQTLINKGFEDNQIFVSLERHMRCGIGKCGHCMIQTKHVCKDGPVFNYEEAKKLLD